MKKKMNFEEAITRLDEILTALESGKVPLDKAMAYYEEGTQLIKSCRKELDEAKARIKILSPKEIQEDSEEND